MARTHLTLGDIEKAAQRLEGHIVQTPCVAYGGAMPPGLTDKQLHFKMELFQKGGSFKLRGALNVVNQLPEATPGITAFSAGNHAIAAAIAGKSAGLPTTVVMPKTANPYRVQRCREEGAEIVFGNDIGELMGLVESLQREQGLALVHPFESWHTVEGTATVGLELMQEVADLDAVIVPVGGGGLIAGVASAVKACNPSCRVIGVEPSGARGMAASLAAGKPLPHVPVNTIADSLGAPLHLPITFGLVQDNVDEMVDVEEQAIRDAMRWFFTSLKLAVEPACAATVAALMGPLKRIEAKRIGIIACGTNIDEVTFHQLLSNGGHNE